MNDVIEFKSIPKYFAKEKSDLKNNTVRIYDQADERFRLLNLWAIKDKYGKIRIVNSETGESFERHIRDITFWNDLWIITWIPFSD